MGRRIISGWLGCIVLSHSTLDMEYLGVYSADNWRIRRFSWIIPNSILYTVKSKRKDSNKSNYYFRYYHVFDKGCVSRPCCSSTCKCSSVIKFRIHFKPMPLGLLNPKGIVFLFEKQKTSVDWFLLLLQISIIIIMPRCSNHSCQL